jgi:hypothetical protein
VVVVEEEEEGLKKRADVLVGVELSRFHISSGWRVGCFTTIRVYTLQGRVRKMGREDKR